MDNPYTFRYDELAKVWVGHYKLLDIFSQGETEEEAYKALESSILLQFNVEKWNGT